MRLAKLMLMLCLFAQISFSQEKPQALEVFYVDNSSRIADDFLNDSLKTFLGKKLGEFKDKNKKFLLFLSNGRNHQVTSSYKEAEKILNRLAATSTEFPNTDEDLRKLRAEILDTYKNFRGGLKLNFFISESLAKAMASEDLAIFAFFPREIFGAYKNFIKGPNEVNVYFPKNALKVSEKTVYAALNFYNVREFSGKHKVFVKGFNL